MSLFSFCIIRRRRRRKEEATTAVQDVGEDEVDETQMYLQRKVELNDNQRRHEMEAVDIRYELEGEDIIHEISGEEEQTPSGRQELRGEEHAQELEDLQLDEMRSGD